MAEAPLVTFEDQDHKRRRLQLHAVDGGLRVNLAAALTNFEAVSFSRQTDGLVLEALPGSEFSSLTFRPEEVVRLEVVQRSAGAVSGSAGALQGRLTGRNDSCPELACGPTASALRHVLIFSSLCCSRCAESACRQDAAGGDGTPRHPCQWSQR